MATLTSSQIRQKFIDYFVQHGHLLEPGASLIPVNDPTLLWVNSGVSALKKYFDGREKPRCNRIVNYQKSIRTNDIENVGLTARHHTFFEMLGNFSIGDYFKRDAIHFAYEFLTSPDWIGLDPQRIYVSVYDEDDQAYDIWVNEVKLDPKRILKTHDNFWQIGDGPCGPDSEIFYDRGTAYDPEHLGERLFFEEIDNDRYIEIWNIVFSQFDGNEGVDRHLFKELPQKNIDTGMGFERLVSLVQQGETNYDTDLFLPIIRQTEHLSNTDYHQEKMAFRVIADHIRTVTFALGDGALFSNEGRGYVLRRILRRAVRYGRKIGIEETFMYQLVDTVVDIMKEFYPNLLASKELIRKLVKLEEERFLKTLSDGETLLDKVLLQSDTQFLDGATAFKLYDTYGFPFELTEEIASERGFKVDRAGFDAAMKEQQERARNARNESESMHSQSKDLLDFTLLSEFVGYQQTTVQSKVIGLFRDGIAVDMLDDDGQVVFEKTVFYAESGGQVADTGVLAGDLADASVVDVQKAPHGQFLHRIHINGGEIHLGDILEQRIDWQRRLKIMKNHSSAHLLQAALKIVLGEHIHQAGSYVSDEYMRFDFTHFEKVSKLQLEQIEALVNQWVSDSYPVTTELLPIEEAKKSGATALFDEKYGDVVRVVTMGEVSKEFCGGTHVGTTSELGVFKIISEESIGSGTRRISAKTSLAAYHVYKEEEALLDEITALLQINSTGKITARISQLEQELHKLKQTQAQLQSLQINSLLEEYLKEVVEVNALNTIIFNVRDISSDQLKTLIERLKQRVESSLIIGVLEEPDKLIIVASASEQAIKAGYKAGELVKEAAQIAGGNGGGRPDFAQAGAKDVSKSSQVTAYLRNKFTK